MDAVISPSSSAVKAGRWWFKYRSLSPLPFFLLMLVLRPEFQPSALQYAIGLFGIFLAESLRLWAVGFAGSATRTRGETVPELVHAGPYRHVRNPLYIANILLYSLAGVLFGFVSLSIGVLLYSCVQYFFIVSFEESLMARTFGASYETYRSKVPQWLFSWVPLCPSSGHHFDAKRAFRSERSTLTSLAAMAVLFFLKRAFFPG